MSVGGVDPGDIVLAGHKGRRFYALVTERRAREFDMNDRSGG